MLRRAGARSTVAKPPEYLLSLRDLRGEHLPMLERFRAEVLTFVQENYGFAPEQVPQSAGARERTSPFVAGAQWPRAIRPLAL